MSKWNELNATQRLGAVGGVLMVVGSVLPWYSWEGFGVSGWGSGLLSVLGILGGVAGAAILVAEPVFGTKPSVGSLDPGQSALVAAGVGLIFVVFRLLSWTSFVGLGLIVSAAGAGLTAYAAFKTVKETGSSIPLVGRSGNEES